MMPSLTVKKLLRLIQFCLFIFAFDSLAFGLRSTKNTAKIEVNKVPAYVPLFSSGNPMVSGLIFKSVIYFGLIFVCGIR